MPPDMDFESASCLGVGALTAAMTLWKWMDVPMPSRLQHPTPTDADPPLLIWGGGAVTGQFATQLAAKAGIPVIVVGSLRTADLLKKLGATHVVSRDGKSDEDIVAEVRAISQGRISRAIDLVGEKTVPLCLQCMSSDTPGTLAPLAMMAKDQSIPENVAVANVEMKRFVLDKSSKIYSQELNRLLADGQIELPEMEIIPGGLSKVEEGLERLKAGTANGKKLVVSLER
jgi:NADPH:quinone reductase-like Zn-dependent oxidoreductase